MSLKQQTWILTGASRGIGRAVALELAHAGANLVLGARNPQALEAVAQECRALGVQAKSVAGDAALDQTAQFLVKAAKVIGNFAGFIHNAGVLHPGPTLWELSEAQFDEVFGANVKAAFQLARYAYPNLIRRGGGVAVFVGSGAAKRNVAGWGAYGAAKAAEHYLAAQLALEEPRITCFVYSPGPVDTDMQRQGREAPGPIATMFQGFKEQGHLLSPEQSARALVRLLQTDPHRFHGKIATYNDA
ncbi:SDR family NAD(P)-dependent oxidoreductase [Calidithermus roseus]|uniref:2,3-dihydro-2,3-dihydroxybenzoate dehydrogenase n=1 Tax=Calidithermus roseus TaxID=1644118 RepID=A0A399EUA0_9DEIN|nr:SDR family oxidoreductase [Calidithermus roseus]RIH85811.1 2,3-dihydro-2,3-dihydroxybenzoate dehydrogenase [Calidithermus roseus]